MEHDAVIIEVGLNEAVSPAVHRHIPQRPLECAADARRCAGRGRDHRALARGRRRGRTASRGHRALRRGTRRDGRLRARDTRRTRSTCPTPSTTASDTVSTCAGATGWRSRRSTSRSVNVVVADAMGVRSLRSSPHPVTTSSATPCRSSSPRSAATALWGWSRRLPRSTSARPARSARSRGPGSSTSRCCARSSCGNRR